MDGIDSVEEELFTRAAYDRPNVILKDGFQTSEIESGIDFEVKEKYKEDVEDDASQVFFDTEELFPLLNAEVIDGATDADEDQDKSPFALLKEKMVPITNDEGVYKKVVKKGTGAVVSPGAICRLHYNSYLEYQDEPFDSTRLRNRQQQMKLGESVIAGFDIALRTMRKGEISQYLFSPNYAFKEMGCPPRIPPNTSVLFEIELVSFVDQAASDEFSEFPPEERNKASFESIHEVAQSFKETGNDLFLRNEFYQSIKKYDKGIQLLEMCRVKDEREEREMNISLLALYINASLCALKLGQGARAKKFGRKALDIDPKNIKAIYRVAQGFQKEGDFGKAREWFLRAQRQEPNNPDIRDAMQKLDRDVQRWKRTEQQMCRRMFPATKPGTPESSVKENIDPKPDEKPPTQISDEVKSLMMKRLHDFLADNQQSEIVFPSSLTENEVNFLVEEAKNSDLHCILPSKKMAYLKITKDKAE
ncbi:inactive peptidyl-prolyl cis-trans isomerase FKBP6-like [Dendronephthya gigantea]|uniref:inactive peptidyl-prolyl cis-trans isomerase FKBP6-like n=1 Tax=Dendronephthya gigantea TaxID=151771 RepID=UPI00106B2D0D|nr:inactive peptidyl-prolyl cis-trans isomerase FKBP6-like [Dendronephthya gigantea]